jgi:hypothetical protein
MRWYTRLLALALFCLCLGCGKSIYPVKGRVHFTDGTPLSQGRVVIDTGMELTGSWGLVRPDGTFEMGTNTPNDGVPPGKHRVYLMNTMTTAPPGFIGVFQPKPLVNPRFNKSETSGLVFEVPAQTEWDIVVEK